MRTEVCITVDTEFSIGGAFAHPETLAPVGARPVHCPVGGVEHGLGFLLECFTTYRIPATFFVETLNTCYFGDGPMGAVTERILAAGQDVQLHLHPCWRAFRDPDWARMLGQTPPDDSCAQRSDDELDDILASGIDALRRMGAPAPIAVRAGNLQADRAFYRALVRHGIDLASNLGLGIYRPADPALALAGGRHLIEDVLELPVLTYTDIELGSRRRRRLFSSVATNEGEAEALLGAARRSGISPVVVLIHPYDFVKRRDPQFEALMPNRIVQNRLVHLCRYISSHSDEFRAVSFCEGRSRWRRAGTTSDPDLRVPLLATLRRMVENKVNDTLWRL